MTRPDKPGKMGWWKNEHESPLRTMFWERRHLAGLAQSGLMSPKPAKAADPAILRAVKERMEADGLEGGLDLTYLEPLLFGGFLQWKAQLIGSCVASGGMRAWTTRALWEIVVLGQAEEMREVCNFDGLDLDAGGRDLLELEFDPKNEPS